MPTHPPTHRQPCSLLVLDDEPAILALLARQLAPEFEVRTAAAPVAAREALADTPADIVVSDLQLGSESGLSFLDWVRRACPRAARVLLTGTARLEDAVDAINGCHVHRIVVKPWKPEDLLGTLRALARTIQLERTHETLLDEYRALAADLERRVAGRTEELETKTRQLEAAVREIEHKNLILEKMALTDPLTGLPNRRAVDLIARKELLRRTRVPAPIALGLIDADHFKSINSAHLLSGGDYVLTWLGRTLHSTIRAADSLGRVGGEEFMVVAPDTDRAGAEVLGDRLRSTIEQAYAVYHGRPIRVTVSLGFAVADTGTPAGFEELRELAAAGLAEAKARGRNKSVVKLLPGEPTTVTPPAVTAMG